ncbi:hypothetical protein SMMN14_05866 [Sphaerulina musiva]
MVLDTWDLECVFPLAQADFPARIDSLARRTPQRHSTPAGVLLFNLPLQKIPLVQGEEEEEALPNPIPLLLQTLHHNLIIIIIVVVEEEEQEQEAREALPIPLEEEDVRRGVIDHDILFCHSQKKKQPSTPQTTIMVKHKLTILVRDYHQQQQQFQDGQLPLLQTVPTTLATATHPTTQPSLFPYLVTTLP